jgi:succinate dehydrogenase/fumarate reductase flavoprotein subunit
MAAGFRDLFAWLLGWKSRHVFVAIPGPFDVVAGEMDCAIASGVVQLAGAAVAETFLSGEIAGEAAHTGSTAGMIFENHTIQGKCHG